MKNTSKDTEVKMQLKVQEKGTFESKNFNFRRGSFSNALDSKLGLKSNPNILKDGFSSWADPSILRPRVPPKLFKQFKLVNHLLPHSTVSVR